MVAVDAREHMENAVESFRQAIGVDIRRPLYDVTYEEATRDAIRRFAYGLGDDNPLWTESDHASGSRWGGIIAPPGFAIACGKVLDEYQPTDEEASRGKDAFAGLNLMHCGDHAKWFQPIREGDLLFMRRYYISCDLRGSEAEGWVAISTFRSQYVNQRDEVVALWDISAIHPFNQPNLSPDPVRHAPEQLEDLDAAYDAEEIRGGDPRYVEDVKVGEELPKRSKGPLATSDVVAWAQGVGRHELAPYRLGRKKRKAGEFAYVQNQSGAWDSIMSCHWDAQVSSAFGMATPFDWGMMRSGYMLHIIQDWMGDDAVIVSMDSRIRAINLMGTVTTVTGKVSHIDATGAWPEVTVEVLCSNQAGKVTATSTIGVRLPSRHEMGSRISPAHRPTEGYSLA